MVDLKRPEQGAWWGSWIELVEKFAQAIMLSPFRSTCACCGRAPVAAGARPVCAAELSLFHDEGAAIHPVETADGAARLRLRQQQGFGTKVKGVLRRIKAVQPNLIMNQEKGGPVLSRRDPRLRFRERLCRYWRHVLRRRSQRRKPDWEQLRPIFDRGFLALVLFTLIPISASTLVSRGGAVCGNPANTDLCGGWSAMAIPTAIPSAAPKARAGGRQALLTPCLAAASFLAFVDNKL